MSKNEIVIKPTKIGNKIISNTWWGQEWCQNINSYSYDFNRLSRGRSYARSGAIKEIRISKNKIVSSVSGHSGDQYETEITCKSNIDDKCNFVVGEILKSPDDMLNISNGDIDEEYKFLFSKDQPSLFPKSDELSYSCTCPDFFSNFKMCKHIISTLYYFGNQLDDNPLLLFEFRGIDTQKFSNNILKHEIKQIYKDKNSDRMLDNDTVNDIFGLEMNTDMVNDFNIDELFNENENNKNEMDEVIETEVFEDKEDNEEEKDSIDIEKLDELNEPVSRTSDVSEQSNAFPKIETNINIGQLEEQEQKIREEISIKESNNFEVEDKQEEPQLENIRQDNTQKSKNKASSKSDIIKYIFSFIFMIGGMMYINHIFALFCILFGFSLLPIIQKNFLKKSSFKIIVPIVLFIIFALTIPSYFKIVVSDDNKLKEILYNEKIKVYTLSLKKIYIRDTNYNYVNIDEVDTEYFIDILKDLTFDKQDDYETYSASNYKVIKCNNNKYIITYKNKKVDNNYCTENLLNY